jgi:hypothetical protein
MSQVINAAPRPLYPREKGEVPIVREAGWAAGPVWTVAPTGACIPGPYSQRRVAIPTELPRTNGQRSVLQIGGLQVYYAATDMPVAVCVDP